MIFYRVVVILLVVFFTVYADENSTDIDIKTHECNENSNGAACYELGQYYSKSDEYNSTNNMFYFYEKGCAKKHDESCIKEIGLIRNENKKSYEFYKIQCNKVPYKERGHLFEFKCVPDMYALKFENVGDIYYAKKEYELAYKNYTIAGGYVNPEAIYKASLMELNGQGTERNITIARRYYLYYLSKSIEKAKFHFPKELDNGRKDGTVKIGFRLMPDGSLENIHLVESSKDDQIDQAVINNISALPKLHPIPKEFKKKYIEITIPISVRF